MPRYRPASAAEARRTLAGRAARSPRGRRRRQRGWSGLGSRRHASTTSCEDRRVTVPSDRTIDADGSVLLTSGDVHPLLVAAVEHAGGTLVGWQLQHVDSQPGFSTTATYAATVDWPSGRRAELFGASARVGGRR